MVAEHGPDLRAAIAFESSCTSLDCIAGTAVIDRAKTNSERVAEFYRALIAARPYPAEIRRLGARTEQQMIDIVNGYNAFAHCGNRTGALSACQTEADTFDDEFTRQTIPVLDAWEPFL